MSFATRYIYYAVIFLGLMILLAVFTGVSFIYQSPLPPPASGNFQYTVSSYNISINPYGVLNYAESQNFMSLNNLTKDALIPILKQENGENITTVIKEILGLNASLIAPVPYWEAEDLAQFLNSSFTGYKILHSYTVPLSPDENESWTQNYLLFNITRFNVTVYNNSYPPSTNVSFSLSISNKTVVVLKNRTCIIWNQGFAGVQFNEEGFYGINATSYNITSAFPYISGGDLVLVPPQNFSSGLIYFSKNLYINGGISVVLIGGATESNSTKIGDGFYVGIAYGYVTSWAFNLPSIQELIFGNEFPSVGDVAFPTNTYAIIVQYNPLGSDINFFISDGGVKYQISYTGLGIQYELGQLIFLNVTLYNNTIIAFVKNLDNSQSVKISVNLKEFYWHPNLQPGLYTIYLGGATNSVNANWFITNAWLYYHVPYFIRVSTIVLKGKGYTYNGTEPVTWLQNGTEFYILRYGDGAYNFSLMYLISGNESYSIFVKIFTNDTLKMIMHYYNITVPRNYTGLEGWINITPITVENNYSGLNYTPKFLLDIQTFPVPSYVVHHPPASLVFDNNYAFEYLEWAEYGLLAENIYNFSVQFTENVTQNLSNCNYTQFWRAEAYAVVTELLSHDLHNNISTIYQHQYPIEALWDGNGTQYEANINLALILENLMPVNVTIGEYYDVVSYSPVEGYWIKNWTYDYVNVQNLPQYWINNTVFLQNNYTYLTDIVSTYKYFSYWQIPNGTCNNVTLYNPLPTMITFHYGTYYLNITPIEFYNATAELQLTYNATAEYKIY